MRRIFAHLTLNILVVNILLTLVSGCYRDQKQEAIPNRIISLAPGITETLFALGLGDRVIGVTSYCNYPLQTKAIEKVGGYSDANLEKIIALHPDMVVLSKEHEKQCAYLNRFGIRTLEIDNSTFDKACSSFALIGKYCGVKGKSDSLIHLFQEQMTTANRSRKIQPKVLFCVGRDSPGSGKIKSIYVAGSTTFYNDLIEAAGGGNAFCDSIPAYPRLSTEGIMTLKPDIIIDIAPAMSNCNCAALVADWFNMDRVPAVKNKRIYCLAKDYATVPGPRMLLLLNDLRHIIAEVDSLDANRRGL